MLIISWNINSIAKRFDEVKELIARYSPDFLCLQKVRCKSNRERFCIPDVRSVFLIRGKRYICEKITATFTENGMSQLLKGVFYPIAET